jgi:hypothetical protein
MPLWGVEPQKPAPVYMSLQFWFVAASASPSQCIVPDAGVEMLKERVAGVASGRPLASSALTEKVCAPSDGA